MACGGGPGGADAAGTAGTEGTDGAAGKLAGSGVPTRDVVLITLDTLRHDALGYRGIKGVPGNPASQTPVLDRLALGGRVFPEAHAHGVVTLPSHTNILTGLYPYQHGIRDNTGYVLGDDVPTLATLLREAGYATGAFVGAFPLDRRFGLARGFDVYDDHYPEGSTPDAFVIAERRGDEVVAPALAWWRSQAGKKRFLWVHLYDPHAPYAPPEPFASRFRGNPYLGEVAAMDSFLAPLLEPFLAGSEAPPTVVAVTADHGEALGDHGELTHGLFTYEATLKVPLILWGPGIPPGVDGRSAGHVDLAPTILQALGLAVPEGMSGHSLLAPPPEQPPAFYFEALSSYLNRGWAPLRGTLAGGKKWIELPLPELYDLAADPAEGSNLFTSDRQAATPLRRLMPREDSWPPGRGAIASSELARLRALGYLASGDQPGKRRFTPEDDPKNLVSLDRKMHEVIDLYSRGELVAAAKLAREVVAERPDMAVGYQHLALVLRQLERPDEAIEALEGALGRGLASPSLIRELGLTLAESGRAAEAVEVLTPIASEDDLETLVALGNAQFVAGELPAARATLERVLARDEDDVKALEGLGAVALAAGQPDLARTWLMRAIALNDRLPIAWNSLGVARYQLGDREGALTAWARSVELDGGQFDALINLGLIAAEAGQPERARSALERFVATAPPNRYAADIARARQLLSRLP